MAEIIDFMDAKQKSELPDPEFVTTDQYGRPMFLFAVEFDYDGGVWSLDFFAYDENDADKRIAAMRDTARYVGQIYSRVDG